MQPLVQALVTNMDKIPDWQMIKSELPTEDELKRQGGLTVRAIASAALGLPAMLANVPAKGMNIAAEALGSDVRWPEQYGAIQQALTDMGLPEPETNIEKGVSFLGEIGVPDPTDAPRVMAGISHLVDPSMAMTLFHGSPHKFNKFSLDNIGTGEGAQAYGHGLYFAENKGVAEGYRAAIKGDKPSAKGFNIDPSRATKDFEYYKTPGGAYKGNTPISESEYEAAYSAAMARWEADAGHLYDVDIPDEAIGKMLDWDKPLSEQPENVQRALAELDPDTYAPSGWDYDESETGQMIYQRLINSADEGGDFNAQKASERLNQLGIPGIRYLDGTSRKGGEGTRNFVVFDDSIVKTLSRNGQPVE